MTSDSTDSPHAAELPVVVVAAAAVARISADRAVLDDLAARFSGREPVLFQFDVSSAGPHFDAAVAAATWMRRFATAWFAVTTRGLAETGHPYNLARRIASLEQLSGGRTAWVHDLSPARQRDADFVTVVQQLWRSWPRESIAADRAAPHFADTGVIRRIGAHGAFPVAGPLNVPSSPQGLPVVVATEPDDDPHRFVDLIVRDRAWSVPGAPRVARVEHAPDLDALQAFAATLPPSHAGPQTLRARLGLGVPALRELASASDRFGAEAEAS